MAGFSPIDMATSRSCRLLIVGRSSTSSAGVRQVPAYLYDLENQRVVQRLTFPERGEYFVSPDGSLVVVDERIIVPNVLPSGRTVGEKYKKTGMLRVYDAVAGRELSTAKLPEDGWLSAIEGSTGYYVTPGLLSVVDLRNGKITATVTLPFALAYVTFHDE